jgi:hypothetical protein
MFRTVGAITEGHQDSSRPLIGDVGDLGVATQFRAPVALEIRTQQLF